MASIPLLPDESPLVTQALRRVSAAIKNAATKAAPAAAATPSPTTTSAWQDLALADAEAWTIHRQPQARLEGGRVVRMRGRLEYPDHNANTVGFIIGTLPEGYRPSTDMVFLQAGDGALEVASDTGEIEIVGSPIVTILFDQVVIPL